MAISGGSVNFSCFPTQNPIRCVTNVIEDPNITDSSSLKKSFLKIRNLGKDNFVNSPFDISAYFCIDCNSKKEKSKSKSISTSFCHHCGKRKPNIKLERPYCKSYFKSHASLRTVSKKKDDSGFCIECGKKVSFDFNLKVVRCQVCWKSNKKGLAVGNYCHYCGKDHSSSLEKPVCRPCYRFLNLPLVPS